MTNTKKIQLLAEWQARIQTADRLIEPVAEVLGLWAQNDRLHPWMT